MTERQTLIHCARVYLAQSRHFTSSACGAASGLIYPLMDDVTDLLRERWNKRHNTEAQRAAVGGPTGAQS